MMTTAILSLLSSLGPISHKKEVAANVETFRKATTDANKAILEILTARELTYSQITTVIENKTIFIDVIISGNKDSKAIDLANPTIALVNNIAVVSPDGRLESFSREFKNGIYHLTKFDWSEN